MTFQIQQSSGAPENFGNLYAVCPHLGILGNFGSMKTALNVEERKLRNPAGEKTLRNTGTNGNLNPFIASGFMNRSISDHIDGKQAFSISSSKLPSMVLAGS